jgi:hypothetical protein
MTHSNLWVGRSVWEILADLVSDEPCQLDHHGYCQSHYYFDDGECPHAEAVRCLASHAYVDTTPGTS